jgi:hypothetical protein
MLSRCWKNSQKQDELEDYQGDHQGSQNLLVVDVGNWIAVLVNVTKNLVRSFFQERLA